MKDFADSINHRFYTIEEAKQLFIDYTLQHGGKVPERFYSADVKTFENRLPNGSRALGNTSIESNTIRLISNGSIITFFHECKHLVDSWKSQNGKWLCNWFDENDDDMSQLSYINNAQNPNLVRINKGKIGLAMSEATAELYASKMYWDLCDDKQQAMRYTANTRTVYDEEIQMLKNIAVILGVSEDRILSWTCENNFGRNQLTKYFEKLTGNKDFWKSLEFRMDYISMLKFVKISYPNFIVNTNSLNNIDIFRSQINNIFKKLMERDIQEQYYLSLGVDKNQFEQIYARKKRLFSNLNRANNFDFSDGEDGR